MYGGKWRLQHEQMEGVLASRTRRQVQVAYKGYAVCEGSRVFKGAQEGVHVRYEFADFSQYQKFKSAIRRINAQYTSEEQTALTDAERGLFDQAARYDIRDPIYKSSEDDEVPNYICKLQRHSGMKLSGWNAACIRDAREESGFAGPALGPPVRLSTPESADGLGLGH